MLSIGKLGKGQENYYLATVAKGVEDYYTGSGEAPGEWAGVGAARLGLSGQVTPEQLRSVLGGVDPTTGDLLGSRTRRDRVPGWDLTFSAPKSVSVLFGLGGGEVSEDVVASHRRAVSEALSYLERHATVSRRRVDGAVQVVRAEGLVVAAFRHRTSRAGDPHLHTHCLAANAVEHVDGGFGALYSPFIYRHARTAGFVYQAILRAELTERLGVAWTDVSNGYAEIDGISPALLERFSKRRGEIEAALAERGEDSPRAARVATLATRAAKDYDVDPDTLAEGWRAEAADLGEGMDDLSAVMGRAAPGFSEAALDEAVDDLAGPRGLTERQASFSRADVVRAWCEALPAGLSVDLEALEELTEAFVEDDQVVSVLDTTAATGTQVLRRADGTVTTAAAVDRRWSTTEMLGVEQRLLAMATDSRGVGAGRVDADVIEQRLAVAPSLSDEQADLVRAVCGSGDGVQVAVGQAGTGKTYSLAAAASVWRTGGYQPIGVALAARAAAELETGAGIASTTVAQFLADADRCDAMVNDRHVVVVDEAAMVDTRRLERLVAHVRGAGAKVVLVGDHYQLPAVEAGGGFAALIGRLGAVELTENRRQREVWERETLERLRTGAGGRAGMVAVVERYDNRGRLHLGETPAEVRGAMVADWYAARSAGESVAMLALRRRDVAELNIRGRALLVEDGTVAGAGMEAGGRTFATGDRVVCLDNDRRIGVHNGLFATVVAADTEADSLTLAVDGGNRRVVVPKSYVADGHLDHAYATTIHKSQGATYERTLLLGDDRLYREAGYTGMSRGRGRNDLYVVIDDDRDLDVELEAHGVAAGDEPHERLVRALGRSGAKTMATDEGPRLADDVTTRSLGELWRERDEMAGDTGSRRRLVELDDQIAWREEVAGRAAEVDRPPHLVELLGEPPTDLAGRERWRVSAGIVESYLARTETPAVEVLSDVDLRREIERELAEADVALVAEDTAELA